MKTNLHSLLMGSALIISMTMYSCNYHEEEKAIFKSNARTTQVEVSTEETEASVKVFEQLAEKAESVETELQKINTPEGDVTLANILMVGILNKVPPQPEYPSAYQVVSLVRPSKAYQAVGLVRPSIIAGIIDDALKSAPIELMPNAYQAVSLVRPSQANIEDEPINAYQVVSVVRPCLQAYRNALAEEANNIGASKTAEMLQSNENQWFELLIKEMANNPEFDVENYFFSADEKDILLKAGLLQQFRRVWYGYMPKALLEE